jgi:hypothetical protein
MFSKNISFKVSKIRNLNLAQAMLGPSIAGVSLSLAKAELILFYFALHCNSHILTIFNMGLRGGGAEYMFSQTYFLMLS